MILKEYSDNEPKIVGIMAMDNSFGIGKDNALPWPKDKEDMAFFREQTMGNIVIMGRKTWESLPNGLPGRMCFVVSNLEGYEPGEGVGKISTNTPPDLAHAISVMSTIYPNNRICIIGGKSVFEQCLPIMDELYLTTFYNQYDCDTYLEPGLITRYKFRLGDPARYIKTGYIINMVREV